MMKRGFTISFILCAILLASSCNRNRSFADRLKDQERAIDRLISEEGLVILKDYPANGVFKDNEFVLLENGLYLNVVDSGNGNKPVLGSTSILCRFSVKWLLMWSGNDTATIDNIVNGTDPIVYKYGATSPTNYNDYSTFFSTVLFTPLEYVGDSSVVKLIIPFNKNDQSSAFYSDGIPLYYKKVLYRFERR
jgi:hypothetical protein